MKFIDKLKDKDIEKAQKHRPKNCPYPSCMTISYSLSKKNQAGACSGLIPNVDDLDCIRLCIFYRTIREGELKVLEHFMTPDEAIIASKVLLSAVEDALDYSSDYQKHYKYLVKKRKLQRKEDG